MESHPDDQGSTGSPLGRELTQVTHPVVEAFRSRRAGDVQLRVADAITTFAGSMPFVYLHAVLFALWMAFVETAPWPTLTLVGSLEGDLPVYVRDDRPEPAVGLPAGQG